MDPITQLITERVQPEQIILLGGCARGEENVHGDLDLMVVLRPVVEPALRGIPSVVQSPNASFYLST